MPPRTRYARSGDLSIAYQVVGDGPVDLVHGPGFVSHLESGWEEPGYAHYLRRLAAFSRLIVFDKRGTGLSDRTAGVSSLGERMDDVRAVMDAAGSARAVIYGFSESAPLACLFAATYPERTAALVLYGGYASEVRQPDYPWRPSAEKYAEGLEAWALTIHETWGNVESREFVNLLAHLAPSVADAAEYRAWFSTTMRLGASPGAVIDLLRMDASIDVRHVLPTVDVPTLVLHRTGCVHQDIGEAQYLTERIPDARLVEVPGIDYLPFVGEVDALIDEIEAFVTGVRPVSVPSRMLTTVLVIDVDGTAGRAVALGDRRWAAVQDRFRELGRRHADRFQGRSLELSGDRVVATFDGPSRAIHCARAIADAAQDLGLATRAGLHTGECEVRDDRERGVALELAAWVAEQAAPDEILVSSTVKDLVAGANLRFAGRGARSIPGVPGEWRLFALLPEVATDAATIGAGPAPALVRAAELSRREQEVLPLVALGLSNRQIADALSISERTVESHVASILAKWRLSSRAQIAAAVGDNHRANASSRH